MSEKLEQSSDLCKSYLGTYQSLPSIAEASQQ